MGKLAVNRYTNAGVIYRPKGLTARETAEWVIRKAEKKRAPSYVRKKYGPCLVSHLSKFWTGYTQLKFDGENWLAHRFIYMVLVRQLSVDEFLCHRCDVRSCVAPKHLRVDTLSVNRKECVERGRANISKGNSHYRSLLTEKDVRKIRRLYKGRGNGPSQPELARLFNVTRGCINCVLLGSTWKHVK